MFNCNVLWQNMCFEPYSRPAIRLQVYACHNSMALSRDYPILPFYRFRTRFKNLELSETEGSNVSNFLFDQPVNQDIDISELNGIYTTNMATVSSVR